MKKLFTLLLAVAASVGTMFAWDYEWVLIGDLYYNLDATSQTAEVTRQYGCYSSGDIIIIPSSVTYNEITYSVTSIGTEAFQGCSGLTSVTIPNSVTSIGSSAFYYCTGLTSVTIGNSVTSIGERAFYNCYGLTSVTIPNSVTSIGNYAFEECYNLTSVTIPNSVTSIGDGAFGHCDGLTSVTIGNGVTSIGNDAFSYCDGLTSVIWNAKNCADFASNNTPFYDLRSQITSFTFGNEVEHIPANLCNGMVNLTSVTIPNNVTSIGDGAFYGCRGLTSVTIGNSVTSIGGHAFYECKSLTSVMIPNSVKSIGKSAFTWCTGLTSVTIGNSVTSIGNSAFEECYNLTSVTIPNSVTSIGNYAFVGCIGLTSVTIGNSVTSIGDMAFWGCTGLASVTIPNSVTSIGAYAFEYCSGLTSLTIGNSVTSIGNQAFYGCYGLTSINVASDNSNYCSVDGVLFNKDKTTLIQYPGDKQGAYTIPNSVTSIGAYAFEYCSGLTSLTIGNSVTSIGNSAFAYCYGLTSITCEAITPPTLGSDVFSYVYKSIPLYVPAGSVSAYKSADQWKDFTNILPISAQKTETTSVQAEPTDNSVSVTWPQVSGAASYELVIKDKDGNVVCTLIFNAQGQLTSIAFNAPSRDGAPQHTQTAGFSFTVTGLEPGTEYNLTITAKNEAGQEIDKKSSSFHTNWPNGIEDIHVDSDKPVKVLMDGQIYILRGEHVYDAGGKMVK